MSNDTQAPNVNIGEQNVPENLAEQSGLPNMSSTKVFKVETDMLVLGDVYADNFIGRGAAGGTYATQVGFNPEDPLDTASVVLDAGTDGTDSLLTVKTIITDGTVDFTGATLIGIPDLVGISLTDLSVSVGAAGVANLEYDNTTGVFTYTPPDISKLDGIEAGATADQTAAEIKTAYESNADTNAFTDADESKLDGIEVGADVTDTTNVTAAGALMDSELTSIASVKALNQGVATTDSPSFVGLTTSGEITANGGIALGDNDKATFGAGDDLQIYHDGFNTLIKESGAGSLLIDATNTYFRNAAGTKDYAWMVDGGAVSLFHNGAAKLATTATGIDVTGTATVGVNGTEYANNYLRFKPTGAAYIDHNPCLS